MKSEEQDSLLKQIQNDLEGQGKEARSGFLLRLKLGSGWGFVPLCVLEFAWFDALTHTKGKIAHAFLSACPFEG